MTCTGEPVRRSVCHCLECQKRSGSAFAIQARWPREQVEISGEAREWTQMGETGQSATFRFCPTCGSTVWYTNEAMPGTVAVAVGAFADPTFPPPTVSVWEVRRHTWVHLGEEIAEHWD